MYNRTWSALHEWAQPVLYDRQTTSTVYTIAIRQIRFKYELYMVICHFYTFSVKNSKICEAKPSKRVNFKPVLHRTRMGTRFQYGILGYIQVYWYEYWAPNVPGDELVPFRLKQSTNILDQARFVTVWTRFANNFHTIAVQFQVRSITVCYGFVRLNTTFTRLTQHLQGLHTVPPTFVRVQFHTIYIQYWYVWALSWSGLHVRLYIRSRTVPHCLSQSCTVSYGLTLSLTVLYGLVRSHTVSHGLVRSRTVSHCLSRSCTVSYGLVWSHTVSHSLVRSRTVSHCLSRSCTVSYGLTLSLTVLYDLVRSHTVSHSLVRSRTVSHCLSRSCTVSYGLTLSLTVLYGLVRSHTVSHGLVRSCTVPHCLSRSSTVSYGLTLSLTVLYGLVRLILFLTVLYDCL